MEESRLVDQFIVNIVDSAIFTQYVQRAFATDNFGDESSGQHFSIRPDIPSYISKEIPELDDPSLSSKLQEWLEQQLTKRFGAENQLSNKLYSSDNKDLVGIGTSVSSEFNHSTKSQARSSQASTDSSTDGLHNNPLSKIGKLTGNEKFDVLEKRLARDQNVLESTIGFGHAPIEISISSSFATSPSNQPPALMQMKKKNSNISVVKYNKEGEMKQPPSEIFPQQLQHHSSVIVRNLAYLYAALVLGKAVNFDGKHVSEDTLLSASRLKIQQIPISNLISLLQKLVKVSTNAANNMTSRVPQDIEWAEFLVILVEMLIPVVKAFGKNVIEMLVRCKAFKTWRYRSILEDQIDANLVPLEHVNQDRLFSYLAENYTKPFSDEDNRNEQISKDEKDLYKNRGEINDKFLDLFQQFRSLSMQGWQNSVESSKYFAASLQTSEFDILCMERRNMQWFARVFVGLYLHNCLLPSTSFKKQDISNADTDPEISRGSLGSSDRLERRYGADNSVFVSSTKTQSSTKNYKTSDGRKAIAKVEYSTPVCGYPIEFCFSGVLSFFSCFILHFNNYMLNQCLASLIFQELHRISTQQVSNRIISKDLASIGNTSSTMPNGVGESMDINSFTLSVLISKYLGKLLGLIHFHHMWTWGKAEYDSFLNLSPLPLPDIITSGLHQGRLCQVIPWVCEYLKLAKPIMDQMSLRRTNKSYDNYLGYLSTFKLLSLLTCHRDFELWSEDLSTNKIYLLIELQQFWKLFPTLQESLISPITLSSEFFGLGSRIILEKAFHLKSFGPCIDRENFAMSGVSLKLLTPQLNDVTRESLALHSTSNINVKKLDADAKQLQPLKKRQDASITGPQNSIPASPLSTTSKNSFRLVQTSKKTQLPRTPNPSIGGMFVRTYSASETRLKSPFKTHGSVPTAGIHMGNSNGIFLNSKAATPIAKNLFSDQAEVTLDDKGSLMVDDKQLQSQDLLEKMDDAFWNYNRDLCELHKFLLFYMRIIGKERVQEHVCLGIHQLSRRLDQTELEKDYDHTTQQLFEEVYYNGQLSITKLYQQVGESLAPKLYTLCSKYSARTVQLACMKTQQQFEFQKHYLVLHLKEYAHRKLREVQESKSKKLNLETSFLNEVKTNDHLFKHQVTIPAGNVQVIERKYDLKEVDKVTENAFQNIKKHVQFLVKKGLLVASESCEFVDINYATPALFTKRLQILCCTLVSIASSTACICTQSCSDVKNQNHGQQKSSISTTEVHPSIRLCRLLSSFAGVLERELIGSQLHEVQDQTSIELSKFLLTIFPHCFAVDLVLLKFYDGVIEDGHFFVSDELLVFIKQGWVGRDSLLRILSSIAREKTGAFYEHCRSLDGMSALLRQGIVFFYRRLVCTWKESNMQKIQTHWCESVNVDSLCSDVTTLLDEKHSEFLKSL